ncbi:MAG: HEAT repeat domain-containing protein, partial [Alphaproteobacteria bacterium]|nr:HEAT repeat domain-containing protein [Alphaproteobacteria bacterium]
PPRALSSGAPPGTALAPAPDSIDDAAWSAAIPGASLAAAASLAAEAARRRLAAAVPALDALCRRFAGFGLQRAVPEQEAALDALARIGGAMAAETVARLLATAAVQGPSLAPALRAAAALQSTLPTGLVEELLRHPDPAVRAAACACARASAATVAALGALLCDGDAGVARAAACALGRMRRGEARPLLARLLREDPDAAVIDAAAPVADADMLVALGRIARLMPALADAALAALESSDDPRAARIAAALGAPAAGS